VKTSKKAIEMIKHHEGVRLDPYQCPAGLWTVGVGHLIGDGKSLPEDWNKKFTMKEVDKILADDLIRFENGINRLTSVSLTQGQFDALVSFSFNVGLGNYQASTLRAKLNRGDYEGASNEFPKWRRGGGRVLPGLVKRRADERNLFLTEDEPEVIEEEVKPEKKSWFKW
jgi:lysozyme